MSDWMFGVPGLASAPLATLRLEHNYIIAHSARFFPRLPQVKRAGGGLIQGYPKAWVGHAGADPFSLDGWWISTNTAVDVLK